MVEVASNAGERLFAANGKRHNLKPQLDVRLEVFACTKSNHPIQQRAVI